MGPRGGAICEGGCFRGQAIPAVLTHMGLLLIRPRTATPTARHNASTCGPVVHAGAPDCGRTARACITANRTICGGPKGCGAAEVLSMAPGAPCGGCGGAHYAGDGGVGRTSIWRPCRRTPAIRACGSRRPTRGSERGARNHRMPQAKLGCEASCPVAQAAGGWRERHRCAFSGQPSFNF
jgi:hypothetical protein